MDQTHHYHVTMRNRTYSYTDAVLQKGCAKVYLLDDEPMAGPQRRLRLQVKALYLRMLTLLTAKNQRGQSWAHDFMGDDYTHVNYEDLDGALEDSEVVDLGKAVSMMTELLCAFKPDHRFGEYNVHTGREFTRVYERNVGRRLQMVAERDAIRAELEEFSKQFRKV